MPQGVSPPRARGSPGGSPFLHAPAPVGVQRDPEMGKPVGKGGEEPPHHDGHSPSLPELPPEGLFPRLPGLTAPAGEFPKAAQKPAVGPPADEDAPPHL